MNDFVDYYELLELSPNANSETIERVVRYFATKWHPDVGGNKERFALLMRAQESLKDPHTRAGYDAKYQKHKERMEEISDIAANAGNDTIDRHKLLCLFYAKRRQAGKKPGLGLATVERMMRCPAEVLEFHLWYFREKNWITREEQGGYSITADGVDRIESTEITRANDKLLAAQRAKQQAGRISNATVVA